MGSHIGQPCLVVVSAAEEEDLTCRLLWAHSNCYAGNQGVALDLGVLVDALDVPWGLAYGDRLGHLVGACQEVACVPEFLGEVPSSYVDHQGHGDHGGHGDREAHGGLVDDDRSLE